MEERLPRQASLLAGLGIGLYLALLVLPRLEPWTFLFRDGSFYAQTARALEQEGSLRQENVQPRSWYDGSLPWYRNVDDAWSNVSVGADGEWFPKHSYLAPLLALPLQWTFGPCGLLAFNLTALWIALFLGYRLAAWTSGEVPALVALGLVLASPLVPWVAYAFSHDVLCGALVAGAAWSMATRRLAWAGLATGLALVAKPTNAVLLVPLLLAWCPGGGRRGLLRFAAGTSLPLGAYGIANWWMYGAPWVTSYHRILTVRNGVPQIVSYGQAFDVPLSQGIRRFFQTSAEGEVWSMAFPAVLAWLGVPWMVRRHWRIALGLAGSLAGFVLVFGKYHYGGARFFLPLLVLAPVPGAALLSGVAGFLEAAWESVRHRTAPVSRRWMVALGLVLLAGLAGATRWYRTRGLPLDGTTLASSVDHLAVRLGDVPCDYFNLAHRRWECSGLDRSADRFTGSPAGTECEDWWGGQAVYLPPGPPGRDRRIDWHPASSGRLLRVRWGRTGRGPPLEIRVLVQGQEAWRRTLEEGAARGEEEVPISWEAGTTVTVEVGPAGATGAVCLDLLPVP
ncbi:MAG TPA: hypothetical protein PLQ97_12870 [Myxococcota bacterium]|nr:hypothetical protein [Myxococcota bacterium]HQK52082.1 hypothetical protein [Myxococcota bacterium]